MLINLKVKTLDARTHEFSIDNEITIRQFKDQIAEKTNILAENQRIIYLGRVLADEKQVKEYDVAGKVLHVAERPPFSQRGANSRNNDEPRPMRNMTRPPTANMRNSPFFRAIDGMLVGTMAIPVNNGSVASPRIPPSRLPNSSSFCINRITVALHMIECANNIAAYLENPEIGLNNQSLDILQRGRWTMESTVVEVGVSSTEPRNNNIIDMVQDAVTAALSRDTAGHNYTVVQLPSVYTNNDDEAQRAAANEGSNDGAAAGGNSDSSEETTAAAVIIEDVIETDDEAGDADVSSERSASPVLAGSAQEMAATGGTTTTGSSGAGSDNATDGEAAADNASNVAFTGIGPRRRTRPQVLANVIESFRNVHTRLAPFIENYYQILRDDPVFEENDTEGRENAQRIFDRVSEAFHYLSHAQHAISDLMLDLSQQGPRVLTCRPILVEQSGYIRSNNIFSPGIVAASPSAELIAPHQLQPPTWVQRPTTTTQTTTTQRNATEQAAASDISQNGTDAVQVLPEAHGATTETAASAATQADDRVEDPVDEPMVAPNPIGTPSNASARAQTPQRPDMDPRAQMARLIQAVVNSATTDTDVHVEFNAPNIMSINLPVHVMTAAVHPPARAPATAGATVSTPATNTPAATGNGTSDSGNASETNSNAAASTSSGTRSGEQRANTLPTTATQTRSTARPQIQIGGNNNWTGRIAPTHTAFDRFLPCNSHHIREPETAAMPLNNNNNNNRSTNAVPNGGAAAGTSTAAGAATNAFASAGRTTDGAPAAPAATPNNSGLASAVATATATPHSTPVLQSPVSEANLRAQLRSFLHQTVFEGAPVNDDTIPHAIGRALAWFNDSLLYLPQYELPEYNSRDSVFNILRLTLRLVIELCHAPGLESGQQFEQRLKQICEQLRTRLYSVLCVCVGRPNAELFWRQLMRLLSGPLRSNFRNEALQFLCIFIDPKIPANADTADAQQFLVLRSSDIDAAATAVNAADQQPVQQAQTLDNDVEMADVASSSELRSNTNSSDIELNAVAAGGVEAATDQPALPQVTVGSEPWHISFPDEWLPVITRDLQTQTEARQQPPYSDAYISGMSAKRRKIIQTEKPTPSVECLIAGSVQRAIHNTGVGAPTGSSAAPTVDAVISAIAHDATVQTSYTEAVRSNARERLKKDADYKPNKYPQITKFAEQK